MTRELVVKYRKEIPALAKEYQLTDVRLFGSVARGDERRARLLCCRVDVIAEQKLMRQRFHETVPADAVDV